MPVKNVAIIGSNFGISGYLPALKKIKIIKLPLFVADQKNHCSNLKKNLIK